MSSERVDRLRKITEEAIAPPFGFGKCWCGCGRKAPIARQTDRRKGHIKDQPVRFICGHQARLQCRQDLRADFYSSVDLNGPIVSPDLGQCWLWLGRRDKDGYGHISVNGRDRYAHHVSLELAGYYRIPEAFGKQQVGHLCDTPACVRVSHLKIWRSQDDTDHKVSKDRQARGEHNGLAKLSQQDVDEIRRLYAVGGISQKALALQFGVHESTIWHIIRGDTWCRPAPEGP